MSESAVSMTLKTDDFLWKSFSCGRCLSLSPFYGQFMLRHSQQKWGRRIAVRIVSQRKYFRRKNFLPHVLPMKWGFPSQAHARTNYLTLLSAYRVVKFKAFGTRKTGGRKSEWIRQRECMDSKLITFPTSVRDFCHRSPSDLPFVQQTKTAQLIWTAGSLWSPTKHPRVWTLKR